MQPLVRTLIDWIEIPSVTGSEGDYGDALARHLEEVGFDVERQPVARGRFNVLARTGRPEVVLCTHLDTVPPWFGPSEDAEYVHGRGACDAKGPAVTMIAAACQLLQGGEERVGLLFTVGEEVDGAGARLAGRELAEPWAPEYIIVGEPTGNRFARAHKGVFKGTLRARGVAGHSAQVLGPSAVHELCGCIADLLDEDWGEHPILGSGSLNFGRIEGGVAPNVVAARAEATLLLRAVEPPEVVEDRIRSALSPQVELVTTGLDNYGPVEFHVPEGREEIVVAFGTDAPYLGSWGTPLLYGPGRIEDAHTERERVSKASLELAVEDYRRTVAELLALRSRRA